VFFKLSEKQPVVLSKQPIVLSKQPIVLSKQPIVLYLGVLIKVENCFGG